MHIFPEGRVHQHPRYQFRYFKWGISRLILETDEVPDVVPIFIMGYDQVMHESRTFPRFLPRVGKDVTMIFGRKVEEKEWEEYRREWKVLCKDVGWDGKSEMPEELRTGERAQDLRIKLTRRVREEVLKLRARKGWPDEEADANDPEKYRNGDYEGCCDDVWEKIPPI
jgi:monolysocardiolipin acyltransferase